MFQDSTIVPTPKATRTSAETKSALTRPVGFMGSETTLACRAATGPAGRASGGRPPDSGLRNADGVGLHLGLAAFEHLPRVHLDRRHDSLLSFLAVIGADGRPLGLGVLPQSL